MSAVVCRRYKDRGPSPPAPLVPVSAGGGGGAWAGGGGRRRSGVGPPKGLFGRAGAMSAAAPEAACPPNENEASAFLATTADEGFSRDTDGSICIVESSLLRSDAKSRELEFAALSCSCFAHALTSIRKGLSMDSRAADDSNDS